MGYTLTAKNSKYTFCGGMGGFFSLRKNIAFAFDEEFGIHYSTLLKYLEDEKDQAFIKKINQILSDDRFPDEDNDIIDFLFANDSNGSISYKTCKKIYDLIKDINFDNKIFTYGAYSDGKDYEHLKDFLLECYSHRRKAYWY